MTPEDTHRIEALISQLTHETPSGSVFDDIATVAAQICDSPISLVSLVDRDRQWFKAHIGLNFDEMAPESSFTAGTALGPDELLIIPDATQDSRFAEHPLVTGEPYIRFYAGVPLVNSEDEVIATLCVSDRVARELSLDQERALRALGAVAMRLLEGRRELFDLAHISSDSVPVAPLCGPRPAPGPPRFLFYSHDGLGLGHTRRNLAIARAITRRSPEACVLLATGAEEVNRYELPERVEVLKLPGIRKEANERYSARRLPIPASDILKLRSALLLGATRSFRPGVMLVDKHAFGASGEFHAALEAVRSQAGRSVLGLRDILDEPAAVAQEWGKGHFARILDYYDEVLVYGDRAVFDAAVEYDFPSAMAERTHFCGYVVNDAVSAYAIETVEATLRTARECGRPVVLATTGAGEDGFPLFDAFLRAAEGAPWQGLLVCGSRLPEGEYQKLVPLAEKAGVRVQRFLPDLPHVLASMDAMVCMGGYNTLVEAIAAAVPTVCIPRTVPRQEQLIRALGFERLGLLHTLLPEDLGVDILRRKVEEVLRVQRDGLGARVRAAIKLDGADRAAERLIGLAQTIHA